MRSFVLKPEEVVWTAIVLLLAGVAVSAHAQVIINEIHLDPADKTSRTEFVELYNTSGSVVNVSGWYLAGAVFYQIPQAIYIPGNGYLVIAQDSAAMSSVYGVTSVGPWEGKLGNEGETLLLNDASGVTRDRVDYGRGFPWPVASQGGSMELLNPTLDNDLGGSWRSSGDTPQSGAPVTFIPAGASGWRYRKGTSEASSPATAWRLTGFSEDGTWATGTTSIGYGDEDDNTILDDMRYGYTTVYLRKQFTIPSGQVPNTLTLSTYLDDGAIVWINGTEVTRQNAPGGTVNYNGTAPVAIGEAEWTDHTLNGANAYLMEGTNTIAIHVLNANDSSSDVSADFKLVSGTGSGSAAPTPKAINSVYVSNAPPQLRQAEHSPQEPTSGQAVTISIKATDPNGVDGVSLDYQVVLPGDYIALDDARYETQWTTVAMAHQGEGVYTATIPGSTQQHRRLIRYKFYAEDNLGAGQAVPYADDPQPNFAYFVYDGVPSWTGAARPGVTSPVVYNSALLESLPVYHLITTRTDHVDAQYIPNSSRGSGYGGSEYLWDGAFVYDGVVYDHIRYRARGGVWRYAMGKNMWKFNFNLTHRFQGKDDYGEDFNVERDKLNFSAIIQQGDYLARGEQGLFESVGFRMFNLVGVEGAKSNYAHFRIIDRASETGETQYDSDFQGLYLALEQPDGKMLDEHGMPDGNFYKMEGGTGESNNQGPDQPTDRSDLDTFLNTYENTTPTDQWWRDNLDLERYYSYRTVVEAIHHYDIGHGKNYFYFHNPVNGKWEVHPWDLDLTWADNMYGPGTEPFYSRVLNRAVFAQEYRNRMREVRDLLYNEEQMTMLLNEYASFVYTPGAPSWVDADRAMWDYNPIMGSNYVNGSKSGYGRYYYRSATDDFPGMMQWMLDYVDSRGAWIDANVLTDSGSVPDTPTISYSGAAGYPVNGLSFSSSISGSAASNFAAFQWRIAEITDEDAPSFDPSEPRKYEITDTWRSSEITPHISSITFPSAYLEAGDLYRVRARVKDSSGRWSHWSQPHQFTAGEGSGVLATDLIFSEIMYHPLEGGAEFLELRNTGATTLDLSGAYFSDGIEFVFPASTFLAAGARLVLVNDGDAAIFAALYDGVSIGGLYGGALSNSGETLTLRDSGGNLLISVTYNDGGDWPASADGFGFSLVPQDEEGDPDDPYTWRASTDSGGSPGSGDSASGIPAVLITELLSHTDLPQVDSIEIHNPTGVTADIRGWYLTDDRTTPKKARIPVENQFIIPPGGYAVIDATDFFSNPGSGLPGFALSSHGEEAYVYSANGGGTLTGYSHGVQFGAAGNGISFGRFISNDGVIHFVPQSANTLGAANAGPKIGPLVITEIYYNPTPGHYEYIELTNVSGTTVSLWDTHPQGNPANTYRVDGVNYVFPTGFTVRPGGKVLITDAPAGAFLTPCRPFGGAVLDNSGETLVLEWPDKPDLEGVPYPTMDTIAYSGGAPWPNANGNGLALHRVVDTEFGNDPSNWAAVSPTHTPGPIVEGSGKFHTWVDLDFAGTELGTFANPFNSFEEGTYVVQLGGTVHFNGAATNRSTNWTGTLGFPVQLNANPAGSFKIGQ